MRDSILAFGLVIAIWAAMIYIVLSDQKREARYNCSISEISPDFTPEMRRQCRELMRRKL